MASVVDLVNQALVGIDAELARHANGCGMVSNPQELEHIRSQLMAMRDRLEANALPPKIARNIGLGRVVTDSWPFDSELGTAVIVAEHAYIEA